MLIEGVVFELCIVKMHMKTDHKEIVKLKLHLKSRTHGHDGIKSVAIGTSVVLVENIAQANEKNHPSIALANIAITHIKRK